VLVVEAAIESGSLITARLAGEQGREVFAIPGSIHSPQSRGCHALIKQGAKLVETAQDVLEELHWGRVTPAPTPNLEAADVPTGQSDLLAVMGFDPCSLDELVGRSGLTADALSVMLLHLELDGHVASLPGGRYQRLAHT
jgi:DNA processing protein